MKVLFASFKYEYGKPAAGLSFEYQNFFDTLAHMPGVEADFFAIDEILAEHGRDQMNQMLIQKVRDSEPDLLFCFLFTEEIKKETISYITQHTATKTFNWFGDDHWRFPIFSKFWAPLFSAVGSTDYSQALAKYQRLGLKNVVHIQWAANPRLFYKQAEDKQHSITFVGLNYSKREQYVNALLTAGLPVEAFGTGWPAGRIAKEQTSKIWGNSKINLNFSESYAYGRKFWLQSLAKLVVKKELGRLKFNAHHFGANLQSALLMRRPQIKSRVFEIPACGGFLLTGDADNLEDYFVDGKEVVIFKDKNDLAEKCRFYLENEPQRTAIAEAGYQRVVRDHTYEKRFTQVFHFMGLS